MASLDPQKRRGLEGTSKTAPLSSSLSLRQERGTAAEEPCATYFAAACVRLTLGLCTRRRPASKRRTRVSCSMQYGPIVSVVQPGCVHLLTMGMDRV
jgi:hypothetical protein